MDQREAFETWFESSRFVMAKVSTREAMYDAWQAARAQGGEAVAWACFGKSSLTQHFTVGSDGPEAERKMEALGFYSYETVPLYTHPAPSVPELTTAMIEAGAQRLVRWDENSVWPDSWSAMDVAAARQDAERVIRSALSVMGGGDEHWAGTPEQEIETLRKMVEQRDAEIERLRAEVGRVARELNLYNPSADAYNGKYVHKGWARRLREAAEKGGGDEY